MDHRHGALRTFLASSRLAELAKDDEALRRLGLIVGGDVTILGERVAVVSTAMPRVQTVRVHDAHLVRHRDGGVAWAKGSGGRPALAWTTSPTRRAATPRRRPSRRRRHTRAVRHVHGRLRPPAGHRPLHNIIVPACHADMFYASASPFPAASARASRRPS